MQPLLDVSNLKTYFHTPEGIVKAADGVEFIIKKGETVGLVGESGCGKSVVSLSILRLIHYPPGRIESGKIIFKNRDLLYLDEHEMKKIRGNEISMIFQEPMTSLNPVFTIGDQIVEVIRLHQRKNRKEALKMAQEMLERVNVPDPKRRLKEYPHQLSGGLRQRVMIAIALSCHPDLLIADEPTTALDVTIQAQFLDLLLTLKDEFKLSILFITHDFGIIAEIAQKVLVMYMGIIVERGDIVNIFKNPLHPYTKGLLKSIPQMQNVQGKKERLKTINGLLPDPLNLPAGCHFEPRCEFSMLKCRVRYPNEYKSDDEHSVRCYLYQ